jgi:hypothetical protein
MKKKDILELKRRLKKDDCTFTKMCGCYVNSEKNIILKFKENFLNLRDEEYYKYLEIAKKTLSGTIGNNLLELNFPFDETSVNNTQLSLMELKKSALKDDAMLDSFYKLIIDSYDYSGNFLIVIFHDAYDVISRTTDNGKLDESEEVYEYLLCSICPVELTAAGLGYFESENEIKARTRDWVVSMPDVGFVFPAFSDRSSDVNSIIYYTKNAKNPHPELMEQALGCNSKKTAYEQKETFNCILNKAVGDDKQKTDHLFMEIQETLNNMIEENNEINGKDAEPIIINKDNIGELLTESGIPEHISSKIEECYNDEFIDAPPIAENLIDKKALDKNEQRKKEERLEKKVQILEEKLETTKKELEANNDTDIIVKVRPEKVSEIKSQIIDGKKYIIIPIEENEQANVNGIASLL